jgi:hypothetical protein
MAMDQIAAEIQVVVDRETRAWDTQDVDLLSSILHPPAGLAVLSRRAAALCRD